MLLLDDGRHLDNRDFAAYSGLFAKDGAHLLSHFVIDIKGDTANAWSRWAFVVPGEKGAVGSL